MADFDKRADALWRGFLGYHRDRVSAAQLAAADKVCHAVRAVLGGRWPEAHTFDDGDGDEVHMTWSAEEGTYAVWLAVLPNCLVAWGAWSPESRVASGCDDGVPAAALPDFASLTADWPPLGFTSRRVCGRG